MMTIALADIRKRCSERPEGYYEELVLKGKVVDDATLLIDEQDWIELFRKYNPDGPSTALSTRPTPPKCC